MITSEKKAKLITNQYEPLQLRRPYLQKVKNYPKSKQNTIKTVTLLIYYVISELDMAICCWVRWQNTELEIQKMFHILLVYIICYCMKAEVLWKHLNYNSVGNIPGLEIYT